MGVDGVVAVVHGGVDLEHLPHHVRVQAHAPDAVVLHQIGGGVVDGEAVEGGGIPHVSDGADAVEDEIGQQRQGAHTQQQERGHEPPVPERQEHHHRQRQADPAGAGEGQADGRQAHRQGKQGQHLPPPALGVEEQGQEEGREHGQHLGEVIGVVKKGVDPPGHSGVEDGVLEGGHYLHPLPALVTAVQGSHGDPGHGDDHQGLELSHLLHRAHHQQHHQEAAGVEQEVAQAHGGGQGAHQPVTDKAHKEQVPGAQPVQLQPVLGAGRTAQKEQRGHRHRPGHVVEVVPNPVGGHQHHQQEQAQEHIGLSPQGRAEAEHQAAVPQPLPHPVEPLGEGAGQVDQGGEDAAGEALRPAGHHGPVPPDKAAQGAPPGQGLGAALQRVQEAAQAAPLPAAAQAGPKGGKKPQQQTVLCDGHKQAAPIFRGYLAQASS